MRCPKCDSENNDSAKFCKKCGTPLKKKVISHENMINSMNNKSNEDNTTKYIIIALIVIAVVLAGAFIYVYGFGHNHSDDSQNAQEQISESVNQDNQPEQSTQDTKTAQSTSKPTSMSILGGSFETGEDLEDKTYASIYVGPEHAGESVTVQIFYSRNGNTLNNGNMVPTTVDSSGYIDVRSADAYKYFPDFAEINLYDSSGNLLDSQSVNLSPQSGTQTF